MKTLGLILVIVSLIALPNYFTTAKEENLVLYFDFEETGNTAIDKSGNGNDGNIIGAKRSDGKIGKGLSFDGEDDDISFPLKGLFPTAGTIFIWVNQNEVSADNSRYIFNHHDPNRIYIKAPEGNLLVTLGNTGLPATGKILTVGVWYHIALAWDNGKYELYLDGELVQEGTYKGLNDINPSSHLCNHKGIDAFNSAIVDELKVFSQTLDETSIRKAVQGEAVFASDKIATTWSTIKSQ
ncbi:LamG domain-containing protein [bacterium]|nr:LamG domain-containing protein [bacterium]